MTKTRGFEAVKNEHRKNWKDSISEEFHVKHEDDKKVKWLADVQLPQRADRRSAGYDFFAPVDMELLPAQKTVLFTDVKAYMQEDEVLEVYPRSSMGIKQGMMLANTVGIIDSSYYENESNDGNIGLALLNTSGKVIKFKRGDRIAQGIFKKYLVADNDEVLAEARVGGMGSSGK